jgi:DHA2 family methylenomycin A resistance protein-like MFS transporter
MCWWSRCQPATPPRTGGRTNYRYTSGQVLLHGSIEELSVRMSVNNSLGSDNNSPGSESLSFPDGGRLPAAPSRSFAALWVAMLGFFVVALDSQVVNVALPDIRSALGGGLSGLQWIVTIYTLMFSALLLVAGTLSDRFGARRAYGTGMVLFVIASAACGLAPTLPMLIVARLIQGAGAALITPTSLALIREAYDNPTRRARAIALWAMGGSVAAAAGPVIGGALTQIDWRLIFFLNLPVGAVALILLSKVARSPRRSHPFDWVGQVAAVAALGATTFAVIEGADRGYGDPLIGGAMVLAVVAAVVFVQAQRRGAYPMVPPSLFGAPVVIVALVVAFVSMAAFYGVVFVQSLYFQEQRGASSVATGLLFLPMTGLVAALNPLVARIAERYGRMLPIIGGLLVMALGMVLLAVTSPHAPVWLVAALMVPVGVGGSFTVPPVTSLLLDAVPPEAAGTASGVLNTARQMGGSLGVAIFGAVLATVPVFQHGLRIDLLATAVLLALSAGAMLRWRA